MPENKQTTIYTTITREAKFPVEPKTRLERIDEISGKTKEQELLEYCRDPRSCQEILAFLKLKYSHWTYTKYIDTLVNAGKLNRTIPRFKASMSQRYVAAEVDIPIPTDETIIEFCKTGRRKKEIGEHFRLSMYQVKVHTDHLVADGRLKCSDASNLKNRWLKFICAETDSPITTDDIIMDYCQKPRSRKEIAERTGLHCKYVHKFINPLVASGKLKMIMTEMSTHSRQQFIVAE